MRCNWPNMTATPIRILPLAPTRTGLSVSVRIMKPTKPTRSEEKCPHHFMNERMVSLVSCLRVLPPPSEHCEGLYWLQGCQSVRSRRHESLAYFRDSVCITLLITATKCGSRCTEASWRTDVPVLRQSSSTGAERRRTTIPGQTFARLSRD